MRDRCTLLIHHMIEKAHITSQNEKATSPHTLVTLNAYLLQQHTHTRRRSPHPWPRGYIPPKKQNPFHYLNYQLLYPSSKEEGAFMGSFVLSVGSRRSIVLIPIVISQRKSRAHSTSLGSNIYLSSLILGQP